MATTYRPDDSIRKNDTAAYTLAAGDKLVIDRGIVLSSVGSYGIVATAGDNEITITGTVAGYAGIHSANAAVNVGSYGVVSGQYYGIYNGSGHLDVENRGIIAGTNHGIEFYGSVATIKNHGLISSGSLTDSLYSAIYLSSTHEAATITNTGTIKATLADSYAIRCYDTNEAPDKVINSGTITGSLHLTGGDDTVITTKGRIFGTIDTGAGEDTIKGSKFGDVLIGGADHDTLSGDKGSDVFEFAVGAGKDVIIDFDAIGGGKKQDYLSLVEDTIYTEKSAHHGRDTILDFGEGNTLTLLHVKNADFSNADIHFMV